MVLLHPQGFLHVEAIFAVLLHPKGQNFRLTDTSRWGLSPTWPRGWREGRLWQDSLICRGVRHIDSKTVFDIFCPLCSLPSETLQQNSLTYSIRTVPTSYVDSKEFTRFFATSKGWEPTCSARFEKQGGKQSMESTILLHLRSSSWANPSHKATILNGSSSLWNLLLKEAHTLCTCCKDPQDISQERMSK